MTKEQPKPQLRCDKCRAKPGPFLPANVGGTHYVIHEHNVGAVGKKVTRNARSCGTWVEDKP